MGTGRSGLGKSGRKKSGGSSGQEKAMVVTATHLTPSSNIDSILNNGFDLSKAGDEGGDNWGAGVYFSTEKKESDFYTKRLGSSEGVSAEIDTSDMLTVHINGKVYSPNHMYDIAASQLPLSVKKEYESTLENTHTTRRRALARTVANHYTGLIIEQIGVDGIDGTTGGNQIVVYDTSVIKNLRRKK